MLHSTASAASAPDHRRDAIRFRDLLYQTDEQVFIADVETATLVDLSDGALRSAGLQRDDLVGKHARDWLVTYPLQTPAQWSALVSAADTSAGISLDLELGSKDGSTYPALLHVTVKSFEGRKYLVATGRKRSPIELRNGDLDRRNVWQTALLAIATHPAVIAGHITTAHEKICQLAQGALPCHAVGIWNVEETSTLRLQDSAGFISVGRGVTVDLTRLPWLLDALNAGRALDVLTMPDAANRERTAKLLAFDNMRACIAAPIRVSGVIASVVIFCHQWPRQWTRGEVEFAAGVADQCAAVALNAHRRHAQTRIQQSEERYRALVRLSSEGIWRIEFPEPVSLDLPVPEQVRRILTGGRVAECNDALARIAGYSHASQITGRLLVDLLNSGDERLELIEAAHENYNVKDLLRHHLDSSGRERWLRRSMTGIIENGHLVRLWGFSSDITALKQAQDVVSMLARSSAKKKGGGFLTCLIEHLATTLGAREAAVILRPGATGAGSCAHWKDGVVSLAPPVWLHSTSDPARSSAFLTDSNGHLIGELAVRFAFPPEDPTSVEFAVEAFAACAATEIERSRHEEELLRSRQQYRSFVEFSAESIFRVDLPQPIPTGLALDEKVERFYQDGFIGECNDASVRHLGLGSRDQIIGQHVWQLIPRGHIHQIRTMLEREDGTSHQEVSHQMPDGSTRWFIRNAVGIREGDFLVRFWCVSHDITDRKILEGQIRALSAHREALLEQERARISREIHDDLGQQLIALKFQVSATLAAAKSTRWELIQPLEESLAQVNAAIASTKQIAAELRPSVLDHFGLAAAVEWHSREFSRTTAIAIDCDVQEGILVRRDRSLAVYRILQESLNNVSRHSQASEAMVTLIAEDSDLVLRVSDNGIGLAENSRPGSGLGVVGMRERAAELGGELTLSSTPHRGTTVEVRFPLESPVDSEAS